MIFAPVMEKLGLPVCDLKVKKEEGNVFVFDIIRKKYVVLTPEEWVRQHFIHLMINHLGYPKTLIKMESAFNYFKSGKRSDIILLDRKADPFLLIECKASVVALNKTVVNQAAVYNKVVKAKYLAVTNGMKNFIWEFDATGYRQLQEFPKFPN